MSSPHLLLVVALLCALIAAVAIFLRPYSFKGRRGNALLLVGPPDAGKTAITSFLTFKQALPTHTSLQVNETQATFSSSSTPKDRAFRIIDVPGHPRIRSQFSNYLGDARGIIFVVDTSNLARSGPAVAEHLHIIMHALTSLPPTTHVPSLVILSHKSDLISVPTSSSRSKIATDRVRSILERELEKRRLQSVSGVGVGSLGDGTEKSAMSGEMGGEMGGLECTGSEGFSFETWEGGEATIIASSLKDGSGTSTVEKGNNSDSYEEARSYDMDGHGLGSLIEWIEDLQ
ncbi:signal recognition particle receptor beta subunit-domain-containing protein [Cantharellus anzutake]|uniref:signal recognition particle receptor beta subunit-domain-containing protein n=1 Tax=Cantharellus anzutake TaxID=1750568 RepID=UPI0019050580|nr:signal recognition particle receptor beta subunit-domain-containing protein [Cantharellus anzutake]KAF8343954.1 signal recognition particle receptor beta subunit-domain-containing protein [Cantharellus anzutake]